MASTRVGNCVVSDFSAYNNASGTTLDSPAIDIEAGDFLLVYGTHYGSQTDVAFATSDAAFTIPQHHGYSDYWPSNVLVGVYRAAAAKAAAVIRMTLGDAATYRALMVYRVRPDAGFAMQCHAFELDGTTGDGTAIATPGVDIYGDNVLAFAAFVEDGTGAVSSVTLGGEAATLISPTSRFHTAYHGFDENAEDVGLAATLASGVQWAAGVTSLKCIGVGNERTGILFNESNSYGADSASRSSVNLPGVLITGWIQVRPLAGDYPRIRGNAYPFYLLGPNTQIYVIGCNYRIDAAGAMTLIYNFNSTVGVPSTAYGFGDQTMYQSTYPRVPEADLDGPHFFAFWYFDDVANSEVHWHMWGKAGPGDELRHAEDDGYQNDYTYAEARAALVTSGMPSGEAAAWTPGNITSISIGYGNDFADGGFSMTGVRVYAQSGMPTIAQLEAIAANPDADVGAWADYELAWNVSADVSDRSGNDRDLTIAGTLYEGFVFGYPGVSAFSVTYSANGGTGTQVDASSPYEPSAEVTVLGVGSIARSGYVFIEWNTAADGSGSAYDPNDTFAMPESDVVLYAQWLAVYGVTYNVNGGTGSQTDASSPYEAAATVTVLGTGSITRSGYRFVEWNTTADGSGTAYDPADTFSMPTSAVVLYAQWVAVYGVTYDGNGAESGTVPIDSGAYAEGESVTVLGNSGGLVIEGSGFNGWNTAADGSGTSYAAGDVLIMGSADITLYAQWTVGITITYDANEATSGQAPTDLRLYTVGEIAYILPNDGNLGRTNYRFRRWNTAADGTGDSYPAGGFITAAASLILYAEWTLVVALDLGLEPPIPNKLGEMFTLTYECCQCHLPMKDYEVMMFRGKPYGIPCGCSADIRQLAGKAK